MLRIQIIGLALVSALVMSVAMAGSAMAEAELHQWLLNNTLLASPVTVHSQGLVLLEDTGTGVRVHCHGFDTGTVGPHGLDLIKSITLELLGIKNLILCLYDKVPAFTCNANAMPDARAINLPWRTELVLHGGLVRDLILADGNGEPGWTVTCINFAGGTTEDTCEAEAGKPGSLALTNEANGVLGTFDAITPRAKCSVGGAETGKVEGTVLTENPSATEKLKVD